MQFPGTLMVRGLTVNQVYAGNGYVGSSPTWGAKEFNACIAQLVEQRTDNPQVSGSSPDACTSINSSISQWLETSADNRFILVRFKVELPDFKVVSLGV
jgi:hypothetical protein